MLAPYRDREVPVCAEHKRSLDSGSPWMADPGHAVVALSDETGCADITILMGQDLPSEPRLKDFGVGPTIGNEVGFSVNLTIKDTDGEQQVAFWMTRGQGELLASWLSEQHDEP